MDQAVSQERSSSGLVPSQAAIRWLEQLVGINTISQESNLGLIELLRDDLAAQGLKTELSYDAAGRKANLLATLESEHSRSGGIVLSGHTDVVPVANQAWSSDPFKLVQRGDRLYGRGTADMKGFIACAVAQVEFFKQAQLPAPLHLALSYDEEIGCFGVPKMIAALKERGARPCACIVGEPTGMQPIVAHKGTHRFSCCVRGREAHSALPNLGVNAVEYAAELIVMIRDLGLELQRTEQPDPGFPVPYTTLQTTLLNGGTAQNIIPRECEFLVDVRTLPSQSFEALYSRIREQAAIVERRMKQVDPNCSIDFEFIFSIPSFTVDEKNQLVQLAKRLAGSQRFERVSFGTEAGLFSRAGMPTVVMGPGAIDDAHRPDESVSLEQLARCEQFLQRLVLPSTMLELQ